MMSRLGIVASHAPTELLEPFANWSAFYQAAKVPPAGGSPRADSSGNGLNGFIRIPFNMAAVAPLTNYRCIASVSGNTLTLVLVDAAFQPIGQIGFLQIGQNNVPFALPANARYIHVVNMSADSSGDFINFNVVPA